MSTTNSRISSIRQSLTVRAARCSLVDWTEWDHLSRLSAGAKGQGLFTTQLIPKGTVIMEYVGVAKTKEQWDMDADGYRREGLETNFGFALRSKAGKFIVDGTKYGNWTRFANHSCNPNCKLDTVSTN